MKRTLYSRVEWRKYLDPTDRPRVNRFLQAQGDYVFDEIVKNIENANINGIESLMILVHPNVSSVVMVDQHDYKEVLQHCLDYFKSKENYEQCAKILKLKKTIKVHTNENVLT